jgi:hypothetical protein
MIAVKRRQRMVARGIDMEKLNKVNEFLLD